MARQIWIIVLIFINSLCFLSNAEITNLDDVNNYQDFANSSHQLTRDRRGTGFVSEFRRHQLQLLVTVCAALIADHSYDHPPTVTETETEKEKFHCRINVKTLSPKHALIIDPSDHTKFLYPDNNGDIWFTQGDPVYLSCGLQGNGFERLSETYYKEFYCLCGDVFEDAAQIKYNFHDLTCRAIPRYAERIIGPDDAYTRIDIGFTVNLDEFLPVIESYVVESLETTVYVKSTISKSLAGGQNTDVRIPYDKFYCCSWTKLDVDTAYNKDAQKDSFNNLLQYKPYNDYDFFTRAHMTPRSTMVYSAAALATYARVNIMPQWEDVHNGNWARIEDHVLKIAKIKQRDLVVYTGIYGGLIRKSNSNNNEFIYLSARKTKEGLVKKFPVAAFHYKIVVDPERNEGVVYVTVNNNVQDDTLLRGHGITCRKAYYNIVGVAMPSGWAPHDRTRGLSYMCSVKDFLDTTCFSIGDSMLSRIDKLLFVGLQTFDNYHYQLITTAATTTISHGGELK